jgi:hypothetical protein
LGCYAAAGAGRRKITGDGWLDSANCLSSGDSPIGVVSVALES